MFVSDIDDSSNCCMIFIDEMGNVYQNWNHFIKTNCLPEGVALAPSQGVYQFENDNDNSTARVNKLLVYKSNNFAYKYKYYVACS